MTNTVLITGANRGIGFEVARQLGRSGWLILLGARNQARGERAAAQLAKEGIRAEWLQIDLDDAATIHTAALTAAHHHPELRLLINNAGIAGDMTAEPMAVTTESLRETLNVNVMGTFEMIKAFTPLLARNHGRIANMTIPTSPSRFWHPFSYIISKSAMNQMVKLFGQSFARKQIPVDIFGIMPGGVSTDLNGHLKSPFVRPVAEGAAAVVKIATDGHHHQGKIVADYGFGQMVGRLIARH
ncbi:SDR family NAD(P)-dependent oxidoreductase [Lacticaseibacillus jixianensis]|uniref:SDR family NAD(P)-dependent oxidoreductase n=1 Tax=Lacticaseibacillus jixianensis TaxID=2486012 RepID=A0ABW4BA02_9LACO|nr:SDR family NAD(P)-dependent oxidoreductase [Lacticaseibacillus jixianensis]